MSYLAERIRLVIQKRCNPYRLFAEMEEKSGIPATSWRRFFRGDQRPTEEMVQAVGAIWPEYAFWLITGETDPPKHINPDYADESAEDVIVKREGAGTRNEKTITNVPVHVIDKVGDDTSHPCYFEWGYVGSGPSVFAANVLYHFGVSLEASRELRDKFAAEVLADLNRKEDRLPASRVNQWIADNSKQIELIDSKHKASPYKTKK